MVCQSQFKLQAGGITQFMANNTVTIRFGFLFVKKSIVFIKFIRNAILLGGKTQYQSGSEVANISEGN